MNRSNVTASRASSESRLVRAMDCRTQMPARSSRGCVVVTPPDPESLHRSGAALLTTQRQRLRVMVDLGMSADNRRAGYFSLRRHERLHAAIDAFDHRGALVPVSARQHVTSAVCPS
jgi:hypothetical protein